MDNRSGACKDAWTAVKEIVCPPAFAQPRMRNDMRLSTVPTASATTTTKINKQQGAGAESRDSTLAVGRAALDDATRNILCVKKGTRFLSLPSGEEKLQSVTSAILNFPAEVVLETGGVKLILKITGYLPTII